MKDGQSKDSLRPHREKRAEICLHADGVKAGECFGRDTSEHARHFGGDNHIIGRL